MVRYNTNGSLDTSFNKTGYVAESFRSRSDYADGASAVALQTTGGTTKIEAECETPFADWSTQDLCGAGELLDVLRQAKALVSREGEPPCEQLCLRGWPRHR